MQEDDRIAFADIDIGHVGVEHGYAFAIRNLFGGDGGVGHGFQLLCSDGTSKSRVPVSVASRRH